MRNLAALFASAALLVSGCGAGETAGTGRSAPTYTVGGTIAGLDEGFVEISNGLDTKSIPADPDGLALDKKFTLDTPLPAGAGYDVRIVNDPQAEFALQCDVVNGRGTMPASKVDNVLVRCARVKSVRLLAGKIPSDSDSRDGLATDARFLDPWGIAVDSAGADATGNVYVADSSNCTIRRITPAGVVSTLAGSAGLCGSSDGSGADARFNSPSGIAVDAMGNVYVADTGNSTIRRITPAGVVSTLAVPVTVPPLNHPQGVAVDANDNVYVADTGNNTIRRITPAGVVSTLAVPVPPFNHPQGVAVDSTGNVYVADTDNNIIRRISPAGVVSTLAGSAGPGGHQDGIGSAASFASPRGIAVDAAGNVYVDDTRNNTVRRITSTGEVSTFAGNAIEPAGSDDGVGADARFNSPQGVAVDGTGNVYVTDSVGNTIRRITSVGVVSTLAGRSTLAGHQDGIGSDAQFSLPNAIAVHAKGDVVYVADSGNSTIRRITAAGEVSTLAGSPGRLGSNDGTGTVASFNSPQGIAVDISGNVYVADTNNSTIRRITPAGEVSTLAGAPGVFNFRNGGAKQAFFFAPRGIAVDAVDNVYVADTGNNTVRRITPAGEVSSLAGNPLQQPGSANGTGEAASFNSPQGIAVDAFGNVYVSDTNASITRRITPSGEVTTMAGVAGLTDPWPSDGPGASARFSRPQGAAIDATGNVYVADSNHRAIRVLNSTAGGLYEVRTVIGGPGDSLTRLGPLPQPIGVPRGLAVTSKRLYFTSGDAVLFLDR